MIDNVKKVIVTYEVCLKCNCVIDTGELCNYGCDYDGALSRPQGTRAIRRYERTEILLSEEIR